MLTQLPVCNISRNFLFQLRRVNVRLSYPGAVTMVIVSNFQNVAMANPTVRTVATNRCANAYHFNVAKEHSDAHMARV